MKNLQSILENTNSNELKVASVIIYIRDNKLSTIENEIVKLDKSNYSIINEAFNSVIIEHSNNPYVSPLYKSNLNKLESMTK